MKIRYPLYPLVLILTIILCANICLPPPISIADVPQLQDTIFTLRYHGIKHEYSFDDLRNLESYSGSGGRLNSIHEITGPFEYTGVKISTLIHEISGAPSVVDLMVVSSDGYVTKFTANQINGQVMVYDSNGEKIGVGGVIMVLAYKEEDVADFPGGPLRIAWVNADAPITDAFLWSKYVEEIDIIDNSTGDYTAPTLTITQPVNGVYIMNHRFFPWLKPLIFGGITVQVSASDEKTGVSEVLFIIDETLKEKKDTQPYQWTWNEKITGSHVLKLIAYDFSGNVATKEQKVLIFHLS